MIEPTDEQIEELAKLLYDAEWGRQDLASKWDDLPGDPWKHAYRTMARVAWDHVARQIMPVQVGDTVAYRGLDMGKAFRDRPVIVDQVVFYRPNVPMYKLVTKPRSRIGWATSEDVTLIPAGEQKENRHGI